MSPMTELVSTILNFTVVVVLLWHFGRKPAKEFFANRSREIGDFVNEARKLSSEARRALKEWQDKLNSAPADIQKQMQDAKAVIAKYRETTLARASAEAKRISEDATLMQAAEAARTKRTLRRQVALESVNQARGYLSHHVDKKDTKKLLTDYLEGVGNGHPG